MLYQLSYTGKSIFSFTKSVLDYTKARILRQGLAQNNKHSPEGEVLIYIKCLGNRQGACVLCLFGFVREWSCFPLELMLGTPPKGWQSNQSDARCTKRYTISWTTKRI
jgi:hypothetical protein